MRRSKSAKVGGREATRRGIVTGITTATETAETETETETETAAESIGIDIARTVTDRAPETKAQIGLVSRAGMIMITGISGRDVPPIMETTAITTNVDIARFAKRNNPLPSQKLPRKSLHG